MARSSSFVNAIIIKWQITTYSPVQIIVIDFLNYWSYEGKCFQTVKAALISEYRKKMRMFE